MLHLPYYVLSYSVDDLRTVEESLSYLCAVFLGAVLSDAGLTGFVNVLFMVPPWVFLFRASCPAMSTPLCWIYLVRILVVWLPCPETPGE